MNEFDEIMKTVNESFQIVEQNRNEEALPIKKRKTLEESTMYKYYELQKNLLVPMKLKNGMYRLVKVPKGKIYRYYTKINRRGKITLCKEVFNKNWLRDVITMPREDFKKYFKEVKK